MECKLRQILKEDGRSQKWLSEKASISMTSLSQIINGKRLPTLPVALRIAKAIKVPVEEIWHEKE